MLSANDTVLLHAPVARERVAHPSRDRTADLARIVRHALMASAATGPLDRAIRSAAQADDSPADESGDVDGRAFRLARRIDAALARRPGALADPHRETLHD